MNTDIFNLILSRAKNSKTIMLVEEKITYNDFYERVKVISNFLKKKFKKK